MKRSFGTLGISVILSLVSSALILNWLVNDDVTESFLIQTSDNNKNNGIEKIEIEFKDKNVVLNIRLYRPMTCDEVFEELGVEDLPLRGKIYAPTCTTNDPEKVTITYKELVNT